MSTLKVTTITDTSDANLSTTADLYKGRAKAWVIFNASSGTPVISESYNVDSITDHGVGQFTINWTSGALTNANYLFVLGCGISDSSASTRSPQGIGMSMTTVVKTTAALRIVAKTGANSASVAANEDASYINVAVFDV